MPMRDDPKVVPRAQRGPSIRLRRNGLPKRKKEEMQTTKGKGQWLVGCQVLDLLILVYV